VVHAQEKTVLTLREVTAADVLPFVRRAAEHRADKTEQLEALSQRVASRSRAFMVYQGERLVFAYTLQLQGRELFITSAAGSAGFDLVQAGLEIIELQAAGLDSVAFLTIRRGLVRKAQRHGYTQTGNIMRKTLTK
jgi:hypothetical protein